MIGSSDDFPKVMELLDNQGEISEARAVAEKGHFFAKRLVEYYDKIKRGDNSSMTKRYLVAAYQDYRKKCSAFLSQ
ncbi:hypothetical protein [Brevibacillus sp. NRS-1366]|uniref:hypothetical protein n=1 Tax=Brevibacillus sp. NRS-1366 TaxID=3233899 RepID=UPI003D1E0D37